MLQIERRFWVIITKMGGPMTVTVLIKRTIVPEKESLLRDIYVELKSLALHEEGYIGAETLKRVGSPGELLIISKWRHVDDWSKWLVSDRRRAYQEKIDALTNAETKFEVYEH